MEDDKEQFWKAVDDVYYSGVVVGGAESSEESESHFSMREAGESRETGSRAGTSNPRPLAGRTSTTDRLALAAWSPPC